MAGSGDLPKANLALCLSSSSRRCGVWVVVVVKAAAALRGFGARFGEQQEAKATGSHMPTNDASSSIMSELYQGKS